MYSTVPWREIQALDHLGHHEVEHPVAPKQSLYAALMTSPPLRRHKPGDAARQQQGHQHEQSHPVQTARSPGKAPVNQVLA